VTIGEADPFTSKSVDAWGVDLAPVAAEIRLAGVVEHDEKDIGSLRRKNCRQETRNHTSDER
jgi:hypothetical protein